MVLVERAGAIGVICRIGMILSQLTLVGCLVPARLGVTRGTVETVQKVQLVEGEQVSELFFDVTAITRGLQEGRAALPPPATQVGTTA